MPEIVPTIYAFKGWYGNHSSAALSRIFFCPLHLSQHGAFDEVD